MFKKISLSLTNTPIPLYIHFLLIFYLQAQHVWTSFFFVLTLTQERIYLPKLQFSSSVGYNKFESVTLDILKSRCGASSVEFIFKYTRIIEFLMMQNVFWNNCMPDTSMINMDHSFCKSHGNVCSENSFEKSNFSQ